MRQKSDGGGSCNRRKKLEREKRKSRRISFPPALQKSLLPAFLCRFLYVGGAFKGRREDSGENLVDV